MYWGRWLKISAALNPKKKRQKLTFLPDRGVPVFFGDRTGLSNFVQILLLNPNFLLAHRNRYSEGMDDGQKTPRGHPDFNSYMKILHVLVFMTDRQTDREINLVWASLTTFLQVNTRCAWAGGTFLRCLRKVP